MADYFHLKGDLSWLLFVTATWELASVFLGLAHVSSYSGHGCSHQFNITYLLLSPSPYNIYIYIYMLPSHIKRSGTFNVTSINSL
jgi:hypothetical protein